MVYTVYSFTASHTEDGLFGIYAGTGAKDLKNLLPVVVDEIRKVCNDKVTEKELVRAKTQLKASMLMSLESSSATAEVLARQMLIFDRIIPIDEMVERIEKSPWTTFKTPQGRFFQQTDLHPAGSNQRPYRI